MSAANIPKEPKESKIKSTLTLKCETWLLEHLIRAVQNVDAISGTDTEIILGVDTSALPKGRGKGRHGARVQYRALADKAVLAGLGEHTWEGIIFSAVLQRGPITKQQLMDSINGLRMKPAESSLQRLKDLGFVASEPISEQPAAEEDIIIK